MAEKFKIHIIYNTMILIVSLPAMGNLESILLNDNYKLILLIIYFYTICIIFFVDTIDVVVVDATDTFYKYFLRFFPFIVIILILSLKSLFLAKTLILLSTILLTKNDAIKDEYRRLASLVFYLFLVDNIISFDFYTTIAFLLWYFIIMKYHTIIIVHIAKNRRIMTNIIYLYMRYFKLKSLFIIGLIFEIVLFSIPFFFFIF